MTVREAALELQCSISFVYKLMTQGQVAYERRGRRKLPVAESVAEYRQRNLVPATAKEPKPAKAPYEYKCLFQDRREKRPSRLRRFTTAADRGIILTTGPSHCGRIARWSRSSRLGRTTARTRPGNLETYAVSA